MPTLLIVHHTPSPALHAMFEAVLAGASTDDIEGVNVVRRPALAATAVDVLAVDVLAVDVLAADGYLLGTPANLGYISGALKHLFDQIYYPCLDETAKRPYGLYVHGNQGTEGAVRAVESITKGMGWQPVSTPVEVLGEPAKADLDACWELGATVAANLID